MKELIGGGAVLLGFGVLLHVNLGQRDRRFKTGYKNNNVPTQMPMAPRLKWTAALWAVGAICFVDAAVLASVAAVAAFLLAVWGTWVFYPHFWSRFQRNTTSNATFVTARLSMCVAVGGMLAYAAFQALSGVTSNPVPTVSAARPSLPAVRADSSRVVTTETSAATRARQLTPQPSSSLTETPVESGGSPDFQPSQSAKERSTPIAVARDAQPNQRTDGSDDADEPYERTPRDLGRRGVGLARSGNASMPSSFNRQFPYMTPAQQDAAAEAQAATSGRSYGGSSTRNGYTPPERAVVVPSRRYSNEHPVDTRADGARMAPRAVGPQGDGP